MKASTVPVAGAAWCMHEDPFQEKGQSTPPCYAAPFSLHSLIFGGFGSIAYLNFPYQSNWITRLRDSQKLKLE